MDPATLKLMAFGMPEAANLSGLSIWQVMNWSDLVKASWESGLYTFRDLVALRTLRKLKNDHGISTQELRRASWFLHEHSDSPWSEFGIGVDGMGNVCYRSPGSDVWLTADGAAQGVFDIAVAKIAEELQRDVKLSRTRPKELQGKFEQSRDVLGNQRRFAGTRIAVELVTARLAEGATVSDLLEEFPVLTQKDIRAAKNLAAA